MKKLNKMDLKGTYNELKTIINEFKPTHIDFESSIFDKLNEKVIEVQEDIDDVYKENEHLEDRCNDLEWELDDVSYELDSYNNSTSLEAVPTSDILDELIDRKTVHKNIIISNNLRDDMKVEILQEIFNKYNLEQLQDLNERFNRKEQR